MRPWPLTTWQAIAHGTQFRYVCELLQSEYWRVIPGCDLVQRRQAGIAAGHLLAHIDFRSPSRTTVARWARELLDLPPSSAGDQEIQWDWDDGFVVAIQRALAYDEPTLGQDEVLAALRLEPSRDATGLGSRGPAIIPAEVSRADALLFCGDIEEAAALYAAVASTEQDPRWRLLLESQATLARARDEPPEAVIDDLLSFCRRADAIGDLDGHLLLLRITIAELLESIGQADQARALLAQAKALSHRVKHHTLEGIRRHALARAYEQIDARISAISAADVASQWLNSDKDLHDSEQHARTIETLCRLRYRYGSDPHSRAYCEDVTGWTNVALVTTATTITSLRLDLADAYNAALEDSPVGAASAVRAFENVADAVHGDGRRPHLDEVLVLQRAAELVSELVPPAIGEDSLADETFGGLEHVAGSSAHVAIAAARIAAQYERIGHIERALQWSHGVVSWALEDPLRAVIDDDIAACHARLGTALYLSQDQRQHATKVVLAGASRDHARLVERMALGASDGVWVELLALRPRTAILARIATDPTLALHNAQLAEIAELLMTRKGLFRSALILHNARDDASRLMLPPEVVDGVLRDLTRKVSVTDLMAWMPDDETLLVEFLVVGDVTAADLRRAFDHELIIAVVTSRAGTAVVEVDRVGQIAQRARQVRAQLGNPDTPLASATDAIERLDHSVWDRVQLAAPPGVRRIIVGIDGPIGVCPVLLSARLGAVDPVFAHIYAGADVVENVATVLRPQACVSCEPALVVGDPDYDAGGSDFDDWEPLPGAADEADAVANRLGVRAITGEAATPEAVSGAQRPRVLHIACHGENTALERALSTSHTSAATLAGASPASTLALAGANASAAGSLSADRVLQLTFHGTELVVLSGCQTAEGVPAPGEDVVGLRAAFRIAGAGAVLGSLWAVDDDVTHMLIVDFYERWLAGQDLRRALTGAQESVRAAHAHPYYWAGWMLLGDV